MYMPVLNSRFIKCNGSSDREMPFSEDLREAGKTTVGIIILKCLKSSKTGIKKILFITEFDTMSLTQLATDTEMNFVL